MRIVKSIKELNKLEKPASIAVGIFDGIHKGHTAVIESALAKAKAENCLSVVLTFRMFGDNVPKGKAIDFKIMSEEIFFNTLERMGVDVVVSVPFDEIRKFYPQDFIKQILYDTLNANYISCGIDFKFGKNASGDVQLLTKVSLDYNIEIIPLPLVIYGGQPISSTRIREAILSGDMPSANDMLGHRYSIDFQIVGGNRIGRTIGAPTINQPYPSSYVVPKFGVYATIATVDGKKHTAVTNVGVKPTVGVVKSPIAETYIQNYEGNLYGQKILVEFLQFLRHETKFDNIDELKARIELDSREAKVLGQLYL